MFMIYSVCTLTSPYLDEYFSDFCGVLIETILSLCIAIAFTVIARINLTVEAKLEVNVKTIIRTICVVGGAALLGRSW